jgi:hypothetical protein
MAREASPTQFCVLMYLNESASQLLHVAGHADTFAASTLRCLNHDRVSDLLSGEHCTFNVEHASRIEDFLWDHTLGIQLRGDASARPWNGGYKCRLGENIGAHFVSEGSHYRGCGADELRGEERQSTRGMH